MVEWSTGMGHVCTREQWCARAADPQALCQRVHAAVKNAQVALKRPGGQMHQGQCGHRSTANMPQFQQEGRTSFSGGGRIATQTVLGRVHLNALALGKTYRCQAALLKINDPPPANLLASPLQMHRQHDQTRAKERNNPECGAFFQTGHPQHGCAAKQTRQRSRQDDFASGSSRLQLFGQPYPWLHGQHPGPHRQGCGPDRKAGW